MATNFLLSTPTNRGITGNNHLRGTESCLDDMGLKNNMTINMSESLAMHIRSFPEGERLRLAELEFELWVTAITRIDNALNGQKTTNERSGRKSI